MKLSSSVEIESSPEEIWPFLEDPQQIARWNPKLVKAEPLSDGAVREGFAYRVTYVMNARPVTSEMVMVKHVPPSELVWRVTGEHERGEFNAVEAYRLFPTERGTRLEQTVLTDMLSKNPILRFVIWLILRLGKPVGVTHLERLKNLVETGGHDPALPAEG